MNTLLYNKNKSIKDSKIIRVISVEPKVKRLGYFKILSLFLNENKKIGEKLIDKKFENYCLNYIEQFKQYQFKQGSVTKTIRGSSVKPYVKTANDLKLLTKLGNIYYPGKTFKVHQVLLNEFSDMNNIFQLNDFDKMFFLEYILREDYFYFTNLLELISIKGTTTFSQLNPDFQTQSINQLEIYEDSNYAEIRILLIDIKKLLNKIKQWKNPNTYSEHIIISRLNWMLDLGIITKENDDFNITETGLKLYQHLCRWNEINKQKVISPDAFLDKFMIQLYDDCFNNSNVVNPKDKELILEKMYEHIQNSFKLFKTLAPNRVTASQAINYTKYMLYFKDNIKMDYQDIIDELSNQNKLIFKYQEQYGDGYIQNKNP